MIYKNGLSDGNIDKMIQDRQTAEATALKQLTSELPGASVTFFHKEGWKASYYQVFYKYHPFARRSDTRLGAILYALSVLHTPNESQ